MYPGCYQRYRHPRHPRPRGVPVPGGNSRFTTAPSKNFWFYTEEDLLIFPFRPRILLFATGWRPSQPSTSSPGKLEISSSLITLTWLACFRHLICCRWVGSLHLSLIWGSQLSFCQISDHKNVEGSNSTSIKLFCHVQSALAVQVQSAQANIKVRMINQYI